MERKLKFQWTHHQRATKSCSVWHPLNVTQLQKNNPCLPGVNSLTVLHFSLPRQKLFPFITFICYRCLHLISQENRNKRLQKMLRPVFSESLSLANPTLAPSQPNASLVLFCFSLKKCVINPRNQDCLILSQTLFVKCPKVSLIAWANSTSTCLPLDTPERPSPQASPPSTPDKACPDWTETSHWTEEVPQEGSWP